jgi:erythronate-4-phosphate dehydrogenase
MLIVADEKIPFLKGVLEPLADVVYFPAREITQQIVKNADALIIRTRTKCNAELLDGSTVKFIATATIGHDHIDSAFCERKGITWTNAAGCNSGSVMQYVASAILTFANEHSIDLKKHVLGVIGAGNVGKKVVRFAESIGMQVVINDPPRAREEGPCGFVSIEGVLREADVITFHVPLNYEGEDRTFHMVDDQFLSRINKGSLLINTSRGEVIDTVALKRAINESKLSGVILDVWENEPSIDKELLSSVFIGTSHIAGYSLDGKSNATTMVVNALNKFYHLGIDGWEVHDLPEPELKIYRYNAENKSLQQIFFDLVNHTYDVRVDDGTLRKAPNDFEYHRGNYPMRREFGAYLIDAKNLLNEDRQMLSRAGFKFL